MAFKENKEIFAIMAPLILIIFFTIFFSFFLGKSITMRAVESSVALTPIKVRIKNIAVSNDILEPNTSVNIIINLGNYEKKSLSLLLVYRILKDDITIVEKNSSFPLGPGEEANYATYFTPSEKGTYVISAQLWDPETGALTDSMEKNIIATIQAPVDSSFQKNSSENLTIYDNDKYKEAAEILITHYSDLLEQLRRGLEEGKIDYIDSKYINEAERKVEDSKRLFNLGLYRESLEMIDNSKSSLSQALLSSQSPKGNFSANISYILIVLCCAILFILIYSVTVFSQKFKELSSGKTKEIENNEKSEIESIIKILEEQKNNGEISEKSYIELKSRAIEKLKMK